MNVTNAQNVYGDIEWPSTPGIMALGNASEVTKSAEIVTYVIYNVRIPNVFGIKVRSRVTCPYHLKTGSILGLKIEPM
jgi:hypothetical protein